MLPGLLALLGGGLSLGSSFLSSKDKGSKDKFKKFGNYNPQQQQLFDLMGGMFNQGGQQGGLGQAWQQLLEQLQGGDEAYDRFAAPMKREFEEETIPGIAERFAGMGANSGALSSSSFGQSLGAAGAGLHDNLGKLRAALQGQARTDIFSLLQNYLKEQPFSVYGQKGQANPLYQAFGGLGNNVMQAGLGGLFK